MQLPFKVNHYLLLVRIDPDVIGDGKAKPLPFPDKWCHRRGQGGRHDLLRVAYAIPQLLAVSAWGWDASLLCWGLCGMRAIQPYLQHWICDCYTFQEPLTAGITASCKNTNSINKDKFNYNLIGHPIKFLVLPFFFVLMKCHCLVISCSVC